MRVDFGGKKKKRKQPCQILEDELDTKSVKEQNEIEMLLDDSGMIPSGTFGNLRFLGEHGLNVYFYYLCIFQHLYECVCVTFKHTRQNLWQFSLTLY